MIEYFIARNSSSSDDDDRQKRNTSNNYNESIGFKIYIHKIVYSILENHLHCLGIDHKKNNNRLYITPHCNLYKMLLLLLLLVSHT
jgi:hypothetical protein